jgi:hyperosmotically inducible periplasmic protein
MGSSEDTMRKIRSNFIAGILVTLLSLPVFGQQIARSGGTYDQQIQQEVTRLLQSDKKFNKVQTSVEDGIVNLSGTVDLYATKAKLEQKARKKDHVAGVRDMVTVAGISMPDAQLESKLADKLRYDREGQGIVFNNLTLGVENGVATIGGVVRTPVDKDSALAAVANTAGVKDVVDQVKVAPVSNFDDSIRLAVARAVYGHLPPSYRLDPQAPIRVVVVNGNVDLYGVVNSAVDRSVALSQARSVPGVFSVNDHLEFPGRG